MSLEKGNSESARSIKNAFENWENESPNSNLWSKLSHSLDRELEKTESLSDTEKNLSGAFNDWESDSPKNDIWSKLSDSLDREFEKNHTLSDTEKSLSAAFNDWDTDSPEDSLWNKIDEDLSQASVWNRLEESLDSASGKDEWLAAAYNDWSANTNHDGWSKLDEALSRERVWNRLNISLSRPVVLTRSWIKYAASLTAFMFLSFFMNDQFNDGENRFVVNTSGKTKPDATIDTPVATDKADQNLASGNTTVKRSIPVQISDDHTDLALQNQGKQPDNSSNEDNQSVQSNPSSDLSFYDVNLGRKGWDFELTSPIARLKVPRVNFSNWTIGIGTQLSMLDDDDRKAISTAAPRFGISADIGFNKHFNHWGISESIGYSQFAQTNGNYVNGRYLSSQQRLSIVQLSTSVFYNWKKFEFNSGLTFNRLINGDEQQNNKIVNVYSMSSIQAGLTAGVTYNISPITNKIRFGVGAQYQWIPTINAGNTVFRDIQGLKISGKLSF